MKQIFQVLLILLFIWSPTLTNAQVLVFSSYEDYQKNTGEEYDKYKTLMQALGSDITLVFKKGKKRVRVKAKAIWGFTIGKELFIIDRKGAPLYVYSQGKICYYENGNAHLEMIRYNKRQASTHGHLSYFSKSLTSEIIAVPHGGLIKFDKKYKQYFEARPEFKELYLCIGKKYKPKHIRACVEAFEVE